MIIIHLLLSLSRHNKYQISTQSIKWQILSCLNCCWILNFTWYGHSINWINTQGWHWQSFAMSNIFSLESKNLVESYSKIVNNFSVSINCKILTFKLFSFTLLTLNPFLFANERTEMKLKIYLSEAWMCSEFGMLITDVEWERVKVDSPFKSLKYFCRTISDFCKTYHTLHSTI